MMTFRKVTETYTVQEPAAFLHKRRFWILLVVESSILSDQRAGMVTLQSLQDGAEVRSTPALPLVVFSCYAVGSNCFPVQLKRKS